MKKTVVALIFAFIFLTACGESLNKPSSVAYPNVTEDDEIQFVTPEPKSTPEQAPIQTEMPQETLPANQNRPEQGAGQESEAENEDLNSTENQVDEEFVPALAQSPSVALEPADGYGSPYVGSGELSNEKMGWYFVRSKDGRPPSAQKEFDISQFGGYYLGDITKKIIYLTFDEGYENGYTEKILDILKEKNVPAAFFVTKPYIRDNEELVKRMAEEGHLVCNHSVKHKSFPSLSDEEIINELKETEDYFKEITSYDMPKFFRPPMGEYSARVLDVVNKQGYKTIFWSFAHKDWLVDDQPTVDEAYQRFMKDLHSGSIPLLHAVSSANTEALPRIIDSARELGYEFVTLYELQ